MQEDEPRSFASPPCYLADFEDPEPPFSSTPATIMNKDQLFIIQYNFYDGKDGPFYCPGCAEVIGLTDFYPILRAKMDIRRVDYPRPRPALVNLIGEENQSCPVLILAEKPVDPPSHLKIQEANGHYFVEGARAIGEYFAHAHSVGVPH